MQIFQHTLTRTVSCTGIGLHSGRKVNLSLRPADPDTGVLFKRSDLPGAPLIPADVHHVVDTRFSTTIGVDGVVISTVEHLLSALAGLGVDNAIVEVDAPELPIMDGSAAPFVFLLKNAGLTSQARPRQLYRVQREVSLSEDGKTVSVSPGEGLSVDFTIDFTHPAIRTQRLGFKLDDKSYAREISRARTFGFLSDMRRLHQANLALGGSLDNAVVLDSHRVLNDDGLRFPDEFVRHKVLDFLGDLALVGRPIQGRFVASKSGHDLNNKLFKKLLADPSAWQLVTPSQEEPTPATAGQARPASGRVGQVSAA
ncbi:MAG: UDP-3-O-acyl-N-acetylglucosamine deacetylase [Desulfarculus sp.]|nr:UDP-3-O-acyl-N-acetylglucosamine deacetylase [Desulfarculus sp.]